nr:hypothetical protein [Streptomyces anulatus]
MVIRHFRGSGGRGGGGRQSGCRRAESRRRDEGALRRCRRSGSGPRWSGGLQPNPPASGRNSNRPTRSPSSDELDPAQHRRALLHLAGQLGTRLLTDAQVTAGLTITIRYADGTTTTRTLPDNTPPAAPPPPSTATPWSWSCTTPPSRTADD